MNYLFLKKELTRHEGYRNKVYLDSVGLPTVGIGHLIVNNEFKMGDILTDVQIDTLFNKDVINAELCAYKVVGKDCYDALSETRQRVILNLCFNLGYRLSQFKKFLAALQTQNYITAATELRNSTWYSQVGKRGVEICDALVNNRYSFEVNQ